MIPKLKCLASYQFKHFSAVFLKCYLYNSTRFISEIIFRKFLDFTNFGNLKISGWEEKFSHFIVDRLLIHLSKNVKHLLCTL